MHFHLIDTKKGESSEVKRKIIPLNNNKQDDMTKEEAEEKLAEHHDFLEKASGVLYPNWGTDHKNSNQILRERAEHYKELQTELLCDAVKPPYQPQKVRISSSTNQSPQFYVLQMG